MFGLSKESLDENGIKKEAEENLKIFLERHKQSLATFTRDQSLRYIGSKSLEKFSLKASEAILYLPLATFVEDDLNNNEILWHIYNELALYTDWKQNAKYYLDREITWKNEIEEITYIISKKTKELLDDDNKIDIKTIREYVKSEILDFLFEMDKYTAFLRVLESCPVYRDEEEREKIIKYMRDNLDPEEIFSSLSHIAFSKSFLIWNIYNKNENLVYEIEKKYDTKIFSQSIYEFLTKELIKEINNDEGIRKRDPLIKSFVYPRFKKYWLEEINSMGTSESSKEEGKRFFEESQKEKTSNKMESTRKDVEETLEEILNLENNNMKSIGEFDNKDLESYGISKKDLELFNFYLDKTKKQRKEMGDFWRKLIGSAKKKINVKRNRQARGKLNVNDLIYNYPDFVEAEQKGNYKELKIFDKNFLESHNKLLPEKIEISFLIDNSGSMNKEKIEATRKTLAATLLSIKDFNNYLQIEAKKTNQKIEVLTETWFFGKNHYKIKDFKDKKDLEKSKIIYSLVKVDASDGTTDDAACLRELYKDIDDEKKRRIKSKKEYKIIFEITDGASTFPGSTKDIVKDLIEDGIEIYAIQIGKISNMDTKTFNYIWNDSFKYKHGIILEEDIQELTKELLKLVKKNLESIFHA